jgi:type IV pilus assembly protein PilM
MPDESIWKKEISFGRKRKESAPEPEQTDTAETAQTDEPTSMWKKEISFGRKKKDAPEPVVEEPVVEEPVVEVQPVVESPVVEEPVVELPVAAVEPDVAADVPGDVQGPDPEPGPAETSADEPMWKKEVSFSRTVEPAAVEVEPVADAEPVVEPEPVAEEASVVAEEPAVVAEVEAVASEEPTETWSATPSLPPEPVASAPELPVHVPVPAPAPGVHAPVTAEELSSLNDGEKKVPFWKKDLSFGGKKAPKAERAPKEPKEKKEKQPRERSAKAPRIKAERGSKGAKRLVGLKIGASQLAAARVANNGSAELLQVAREPLEAGIVVGGELRDPDALAAALKEFFAKHKLPKKGVRLGIANNRIGVRTFEIAGIQDQKQLTNAVRFRAQEALPIPIDEAVLDFQVLGEGVGEDGAPTKRILLVVAYRELIDRYMDACKKAGISLVGIDLEAFALLRALQAPQDGTGSDPSAALVAVAIGHDRSTFAVSDGRTCEFTRVLEWGGAALNVAIARALDAAPSEVDIVKRALALTDEMVPESLTAEQAQKARDAMRRAIQTFARELVSSLQYYQNQPGSLGIGEIVLTGGTAHLHGLAGELERLIGVRVRVGDPLARMKVSKRVGEAEQIGSLAVAIGLGIED